RNAGLALLAIMLVSLLSVQIPSPVVQAQEVIVLNPSSISASIAPGGSTTQTLNITNSTLSSGNTDRTVSISISSISGFTITSSSAALIATGNNHDFQLTITSNSTTQAPGTYRTTATVSAVPTSGTTYSTSFQITILVTGSTFTPTPSQTATPGTPTITPTAGPICADGFEDDDNPASSKPIDANTTQEHVMCSVGDEDWLTFGGVAGKIYTIDVIVQAPGLDLTLELFDPNLNSIAFNDDYYNRDPTKPNPGDTKPLLTLRMPTDGPYYIRVRDAAGRGDIDYFYQISLRDESYGPTPTMIREVCLDRFEPDGLPEQARLITSNEIQEEHRLCPTGDADWIVFFAKTGKRYIIFTDTRRYAGAAPVNGQAQAGADTVMVLTDRDGVSMIDVNDDIPGASTLDSQIEFTPDVDGFYFVQVKNVGDIGNQFIRYDLTLLLCIPGQTNCGRGEVNTSQPVNPSTPEPTGTPFTLHATRP
ncbi:MAG: peptidase, partial [Oscillochloris sp.]|nr:peptidase [Oscillochloris sp.]